MTPRMATATIPKKLPPRTHQESSEEFATGSVGSAGGSAVGSSATSTGNVIKAKGPPPAVAQTPAAAPTPTTKNTRRKSEDNTLDQYSTASSTQNNKASSSVNSPPNGRRPFRKRKGSVDFALSIPGDDETDTKAILPNSDALPSMDSLPMMDVPASPYRLRSLSIASGLISGSGASLEQLDALGEEAHVAASRIKSDSIDLSGRSRRKGSASQESKGSGNSDSHGTFTSQSHRFLLEAFMGDGTESLVDSKAAEEAETFEIRRERMGSFDIQRDRLGSFDVRERVGSFDVGALNFRGRIGSFDGRRERLESWGGMSDLSIPVPDISGTDSLIGNGGSSAAALAATIYSSLANDLTAAANVDGEESISSFLVSDEKIPTKISMNRSRLNSVASAATDPSLSDVPSETEIPSDIQKFVKAAMASVGDQLAEIAVAATEAVKDTEDQSELSSTASPMIGASETGSLSGRPRAFSLAGSAMDIAVDYEAVAAAIDAAEAAAGAIDLAAFAHSASETSSVASKTRTKRKKMTLPKTATDVARAPSKTEQPKVAARMELPPIPKTKMDERDMELIRERARAAAGYVPPSKRPEGEQTLPPPKKKAKLDPQTPSTKPPIAHSTPKAVGSVVKSVASTPYTPAASTPGSIKTPASKGQSSQKWDSMFDCLLQFIEDQRSQETAKMSEDEKKAWVWDGNVPTTYKTKDGKALGRWVNNQRSAKSKGVLKEEREERLVKAGLKWSVLASNCWNVMLEELRIYVNDQTKSGRKWDGNVPTNYQVKTKAGATLKDDEEKNLGRWVNRQRSLYQAGKLRKDRQVSLEQVGLKWSMLATTSWESMYDTLCEYVASKTKDGGEWDGNVPANYRTNDDPPRALGRWINRQRSAFGKNKLKPEYVQVLNDIGLKWCVHERRPVTATPEAVASSSTARAIEPVASSTKDNMNVDNGNKPNNGSSNKINNSILANQTGDKNGSNNSSSENNSEGNSNSKIHSDQDNEASNSNGTDTNGNSESNNTSNGNNDNNSSRSNNNSDRNNSNTSTSTPNHNNSRVASTPEKPAATNKPVSSESSIAKDNVNSSNSEPPPVLSDEHVKKMS